MIENVFSKANVTSRAMVHIIYASKVLKFIWFKIGAYADLYFEDHLEKKLVKVSLTMFSLSTSMKPKIRNDMSKIHAKLERKQKYDTTKHNLFEQFMDGEELTEDEKSLSLLEQFKGIGWIDEKGWKIVSKTLRTVRCFSFADNSR